MFSFSLSSAGNRDNSTKMTRNLINDGNWYPSYNSPYEPPPRATIPQRRKHRDSWGDPIPFGVTTDNLELSGDGVLNDKRSLHEQHDIKYGVRGVFDEDWKRVGPSEISRIGVASDKQRERRASCGRDQIPPSSDPVKSTHSTTSRRRSTISSGNSPTVPNYMHISGGVGESPVPHRRAQKDANRISLGSIFTFGSKIRMGSPTRGMDDSKEREENISARPTSNPEKGRVRKLSILASVTEKHSTRKTQQTDYYALSNETEDYHNSLYSTLLADGDDGTPARHKRSREQFHPSSTAHVSRVEKPGQPRPRACSRQNLNVAPVGHPYAPYAHQSQDHHDRGLRDEILPSPSLDDHPAIPRQRHPYNQAQLIYTRYPYGRDSVSTGPSSPSYNNAPQKRGSGQSEHHSECPQVVLYPTATAVASGLGITNSGVGGVVFEPEIHGKKLKISRSTPNFQIQANDDPNSAVCPSNAIPQSAPPMPSLYVKQLPPPRPKDRWLSAETWCDALVFPRPKLKLKQGKNATLYNQADESFIGGPVSGRIISPPPSPVGGEWDTGERQLQSKPGDQRGGGSGDRGAVQKQREPGIPSRVLAHSRSFELQTRSGKEKAECLSDIESRAVRQGRAKVVPLARDRSGMQDFLSPPTPVPDLDEVLSEGRLLYEERQAWQTLAVNSFGNKRSRSLSRTRTKSLTRKGRSSMRKKERNTVADESDGQGGESERRGQSSLDYLAAQACLGNQTASATLIVSSPNPDSTTPGMHSHSNSHSTTARTLPAKSSKSHSRNNSVVNSGIHAGRITMGKLCGNIGLEVDLDLDHVERENLLSNAACAPQGANIRTPPDLEGALKGQGTKVIRLADPAHIPVDKGLPVSQPVSSNPLVTQTHRTPSPDLFVSNLSAINHPKVAIAIGTLPEEEEGAPAVVPVPLTVSASYVPNHPYAQGGLSFSVQTSSGRERLTDSRGPVGVGNVLPLSEILARHQVSPHPYSLSSANTDPFSRLSINVARDSYHANGLNGQFRSDDRMPDPSSMWAQLLPDVGREILPEDLQSSPYGPDLKGIENQEGTKVSRRDIQDERMRSIHDTAGVAEALLSTTSYERDGNMLHEETKDEDRIAERVDSSERLQPNDTHILVAFNDLRKPSHASSAHTIASSHLDPAVTSTSTRLESLNDLETASHAPTSGSPLPRFRLLGNPNDLDSFQDLFYQPSTTGIRDSPASPDGTADVVSWDAAVRNRRTGSSLTSLARQLGEEYEALVSVDTSRTSSLQLHSRSRSLGGQPQLSGLSAEGNLQFILEEVASAESPHRMPNIHDTVLAFESATLPEDVYSLQASSITDGNGEDDDPTGLLRLGTVESVSTPAAVDVEHRISFNGETVFDYQDQVSPAINLSTDTERPGNAVSRRDLLPIGLSSQRPLTQVTRSSGMTTSDLSRISGLSDFPVPPKSIYSEQPESSLPTPAPHNPVLNTYFESGRKDDGVPQVNTPFLRPEYARPPSVGPTSHGLLPQGGQVEFGIDQSAVELAKALSSPEPM